MYSAWIYGETFEEALAVAGEWVGTMAEADRKSSACKM
jgi:hypothetical protein